MSDRIRDCGRQRQIASGPLRLVLLAICAGLAILPLTLGSMLAEASLRTLCAWTSLAACFVIAAVALSSRRGVFSLAAIYAGVFAVFHFGLTGAYALGYDVTTSRVDPWLHLWFLDAATPRAILLAVSGIGGFGLGVLWQSLPGPAAGPRGPVWVETFPADRLGLTVLTASVLGWFFLVAQTGGAALLVASYGDFLAATHGVPLLFANLGIGIGMAFLFTGDGGPVRRTGLAVFGFWALVAFPLGLRGNVLFPLGAAIGLASFRHPPLRASRLAILVLAILVAIALERQIRQVGMGGLEPSRLNANPLDALAEMGASLRPVHIALGWAANGDPPLLGGSYWAPVERIVHYLTPLWERLPSTADQRLLNVLVQQRVGQVGFSPVAEAYLNFRAVGPAAVMALTGALFGWIDRLPTTRANQILAAPIVVPLFLQVRNAFAQVPGQILAGYLVLGGALLVWAAVRPRHPECPATVD